MTRHRVIALGFLLLVVGAMVFVLFARNGSHSTPSTVQIGIAVSDASPKVVTAFWVAFLLAPDGSLWGWGDNSAGLLSKDRAARWTTPRRLGPNTDWIDVATSAGRVILLKKDGTIWGWDQTGSNGAPGIPIQLFNNAGWQAVSAGAMHCLASREDGTLWAWGWNKHGQLGDGTLVDQSAPIQVGTNRSWRAVAAGAFHSLGLRADGSVWCWGRIDPSQPASPAPRNIPEPTQVGTGKEWIAIAAGGYHCVAQQSDSSLGLWGPNAAAIIGPTNLSNSLVRAGSGEHFERIVAGTIHCLALAKDGTLWGWGLNSRGSLAGLPPTVARPTRFDNRNDWVGVWSRGEASFALAADGTLWTWGVQLGELMEIGFGDRVSQWTGNVLRRLGMNTRIGQSVSQTPRFTPKPWPIAKFVPAKQETREE